MADEMEDIGGIQVSIGASHAQLVSDLARADQLLEAWAKQKFTVNIGASVSTPSGGSAAARPSGPAPVVFGARATAAAQAQNSAPAFQRAVNAELAKTGQTWNSVTGEIEDASKAVKAHKAVIVDVQQTAAQPTQLNVETGALQNDLNSILATMREIVATAGSLSSVSVGRAGVAGGGAGGGGSALTPNQRAVNTDLTNRITRASAGRGAAFPPLEETRGAALTSSTFAPPLTQARQAQLVREREAAAAAGPQQRTITPSRRQAITAQAQDERRARQALRAEQRRDEEVFAQSTPDKAAQRQRQIEERVAVQRATITAAGRTGRTEASGLGALFGGAQGKLIEARSQLAGAERNVTEAERAALPFRKRIAEYDLDIANSSGKVAAARKRSRDAFVSDPKTVAALDNEKKALEGQESALARINKLQGASSILRNLTAITIGGAAFSVGFAAVGAAINLTEKAIQPAIDRLTGFATVEGRVTDALSDQTKQAQGNVQAVIATTAAQAGLSAASTRIISPLLTQQVAIEASNKSLSDGVDLFEAYTKARGGLAGINTNTGGILGSGILGTPSTEESIGRLFQGLPSPANRGPNGATAGFMPSFTSGIGGFNPFGVFGGTENQVPVNPQANNALFQQGLDFVNSQAVKGGENNLRFVNGQGDQGAVDRAVKAAQDAHAPDDFINSLRDGKIAISGLSTDAGEAARQVNLLATAIASGSLLPDLANLGTIALRNEQQRQRVSAASLDAIRSQQAFQLPSQIGLAARQQQYALQNQQPAQYALQNLARPLLPVGTGIAAGDQAKVAAGIREAQGLQDQLNARYQQGQQVIENTYKPSIIQNFGAAAGQAFTEALGAVEQTGARIASIQAGLSNEQAAYQVAQYNFQLLIAKRTLGDIEGLTGQNYGVQQTQLGVLERQNLQLSRQGQLLQFGLSQRQINYQTAVAGFSAPGVTPEERQANIAEAKIEASYAQKQLDIQRQMFGNQVKIVDIGNLRQGADLLKQIGLLQQGRQVTLDTTVAEKKLALLSQLQDQNVAKVGTYLSAVDGLASTAMGDIAQIEAAAGKAMAGIAVSILGQFGIFFGGVNQYLSAYNRIANTSANGAGTTPGGHPLPAPTATGGMFNVSSPTMIGNNRIAGEAGNETLLILSHPRSAGTGTSGGNVVNFNGDITVRNDADIDAIARKVMGAMGKTGSLLGLRSVG